MAPKKEHDETYRSVKYKVVGDLDVQLYLLGSEGAAFPEEARLLFMRQGTNDGAEVDLTNPGQLVEIRDMLNEAIQEFGL